MDLNMRKILIADGKPIIKLDPHTQILNRHTHVARKVNFALTFADILQPKIIKPNVTHCNRARKVAGGRGRWMASESEPQGGTCCRVSILFGFSTFALALHEPN